MQKIAAYLLERREGMERVDRRAAEVEMIRSRLQDWLRSKGATGTASSGTYIAEDDSRATYVVENATDEDRSWWMVRLEELSTQGRRFAAAVSVTSVSGLVAVYGSLEAGSDATVIDAVDINAKCPKVIRTLLDLPGQWFHGSSRLVPLQRAQRFEEGAAIAAELLSAERTIPFVVVSEDEHGAALPDLHKHLAHDLSGLANVVVVEEDASWAITDSVGPELACYGGAVRLYWPRLSKKDLPYRHSLEGGAAPRHPGQSAGHPSAVSPATPQHGDARRGPWRGEAASD
jgi:hypothetical protein